VFNFLGAALCYKPCCAAHLGSCVPKVEEPSGNAPLSGWQAFPSDTLLHFQKRSLPYPPLHARTLTHTHLHTHTHTHTQTRTIFIFLCILCVFAYLLVCVPCYFFHTEVQGAKKIVKQGSVCCGGTLSLGAGVAPCSSLASGYARWWAGGKGSFGLQQLEAETFAPREDIFLLFLVQPRMSSPTLQHPKIRFDVAVH
jgi:hypothetical protein